MRRHTLSLVIASIVVLASLPTWPVWAQTTACQVAPLFLMLRDQVGRERVGDCTGQPTHNDAGDLNQPTTRGILTFRTSDQVAAFSDGQTTWLYGPNGLESRPSGGRLAWESSTAAASASGATYSTPTPTPTMASTSYNSAWQLTPTPTPWGQTASGLPMATPTTQTTGSWPPQNGALAQPDATLPQNGASQPQNAMPLPQNAMPLPQSANAPVPAAVPSPMILNPSALPIELSGSDSTTSKPIDLAGGTYAVHWEAQIEKGKSACYVGSRLRRFDDQNPGALVVHTTLGSTKDRSVSGDTRLFSVQPGRYVIDVSTTGCSWKLAIQAP
jgi:hypothetical protein